MIEVSADSRFLYPLVVVWILLPVVTLAAAWVQLLRAPAKIPDALPAPFVPLMIMSVSYFLFILGLFAVDLVGPDYSERRFVTIYAHLVLVVVVTVWGTIAGQRIRVALFASGTLTAGLWGYLAVVSAVV
jgi:hypothetical protein